MNKFVIITTVYNLIDWLPINLQMMKYQSNKNWHCVYIDDWSDDGSFEYLQTMISDDDRFTLLRTDKPKSRQGAGFLKAVDSVKENLDGEDIIVEVDGDDWLSSAFVLDYLSEIYKDGSVWMTYGQYQMFPTGMVGGHYSMTIDNGVDLNNDYRKAPFPYSHLKTYKLWLLERVDRRDLIDPKTGEVWSSAWDHALCIPMVEMAGKSHIHRCDDILYVLNRSQELQNEGKTRVEEQKRAEADIRQLKRYKKIVKWK